MAQFDRPYTTFYWSVIVNIALSCTAFELFDVEQYRDLEIWVTGHSRSFKMVPFESLGAVSDSPSIVTMALSCIISKTNRYIENRDFFIPLAFDAPIKGGSRRNIAIPFGTEKPEWWGYLMVNKLRICSAVSTEYRRVTDGQTSCDGIVRAMHTRRAVKMSTSCCCCCWVLLVCRYDVHRIPNISEMMHCISVTEKRYKVNLPI